MYVHISLKVIALGDYILRSKELKHCSQINFKNCSPFYTDAIKQGALTTMKIFKKAPIFQMGNNTRWQNFLISKDWCLQMKSVISFDSINQSHRCKHFANFKEAIRFYRCHGNLTWHSFHQLNGSSQTTKRLVCTPFMYENRYVRLKQHIQKWSFYTGIHTSIR